MSEYLSQNILKCYLYIDYEYNYIYFIEYNHMFNALQERSE